MMALKIKQCFMRFSNNAARFGFSLVRNITVKSSNDSLEIDWESENGTVSSYPHIFLRDNCQCDECYHSTAKQRLFDTALSVSIDIKPESVWQTADAVNIVWEGGHRSSFAFKWLQERRFPATSADIRSKSNCGLEPRTWGSELNGRIPTFDYRSVISEDATMLSWLETVASTGIALIENAPTSLDIYPEICKKLFCRIRSTHYG